MIIVRLCFIVIAVVVVVVRVLDLVSGDFGVDVCGGGGSMMFLNALLLYVYFKLDLVSSLY